MSLVRVFHGSHPFHSPEAPEQWERVQGHHQKTQVKDGHTLVGYLYSYIPPVNAFDFTHLFWVLSTQLECV